MSSIIEGDADIWFYIITVAVWPSIVFKILKKLTKAKRNLTLALFSIFGCIIFTFVTNPELINTFKTLFKLEHGPKICFYWSFVIIQVLFLANYAKEANWSKNTMRKLFHFMFVFLFFGGFYNEEFFKKVLAIAFAGFVNFEFLRSTCREESSLANLYH